MLRQDETDKPLIAIWIPEAMEWSMLGSNTEEGGGVSGHSPPPPPPPLLHFLSPPKDWNKTTSDPNSYKQFIYTYNLMKHCKDGEDILLDILHGMLSEMYSYFWIWTNKTHRYINLSFSSNPGNKLGKIGEKGRCCILMRRRLTHTFLSHWI